MNNFFKNKNVVVTGGAGFIGSHLVRKLVSLEANVTVIDDLSRGKLKKLKDIKSKINFLKVDLSNQKKITKAFANQEIVFNLAALNTGVDFDLGRTEVMFEENLMLQMIPLRVASKFKSIKRFVQISSASVYSREAMENQVPTPEDADTSLPEPSKLGYALAKKMGEYLASWYYADTGLETVCVRFINVYGEDDNFDQMGHFIPVMIRKFIEAKGEVEVFGSGKQKRSFIHVDDAVSALLLLAEKGKPGESYNVDTNNERSVKEVVDEIAKSFTTKKLKITFDKTKPEGSQRRMLDNKKLLRLGWKSQISFEDGLLRTINNIKKELKFNQ